MFLFNSAEVYIGYSLEELAKVREILSMNGIKYKYKIVNHSGQWNGRGTIRGSYGSAGQNKNFERQYYVYVKKNDYENGKYLVNKALHKL